jgi:N-acetylneuraminate lyase
MTSHHTFRFIAAPFTPLHADGSIACEFVPRIADFLSARGVSGVFVNGTTGEGLSLTLDERIQLAEAWKTASAGRLKFIVHVGHTCAKDAGHLARHAEALGADAIAMVGPGFYTVSDPALLAEYCASIATEAPGTPCYYYHIPSMLRVGCNVSDAFPHFVEQIPTFAGVKFTHDDLADYRRCIALAGEKYEIFFGRDELLLDALLAGGRSAVGSTYNFAAPLYQKIVQATENGSPTEARKLQDLAAEAIRLMVRAGGMSGVRAVLRMEGIDCGPMRLPLKAMDDAGCENLRAELEALGYLEKIRPD